MVDTINISMDILVLAFTVVVIILTLIYFYFYCSKSSRKKVPENLQKNEFMLNARLKYFENLKPTKNVFNKSSNEVKTREVETNVESKKKEESNKKTNMKIQNKLKNKVLEEKTDQKKKDKQLLSFQKQVNLRSFLSTNIGNYNPVTQPIKSIEQLLYWNPGFDEFSVSTICRRQVTRDRKYPKTLVCHDFRGGYVEDRFVQGYPSSTCYRLYSWSLIDTFCYFSHNFVTIPPVNWTNAAHANGVKSMGTFITEWKDGAKICAQIFSDEAKVQCVVDILVEITCYYGFDGWLINIENDLILEGLNGEEDNHTNIIDNYLNKYFEKYSNVSETLEKYGDDIDIEKYSDGIKNYNDFKSGYLGVHKKQEYWNIRKKFSDVSQVYTFVLASYTTIGLNGMYLQTWKSQLFYVFTMPIGFLLYFTTIHLFVKEFYSMLAFSAYYICLSKHSQWTMDQRDLYQKFKICIFSAYLLIFFLTSFALISLLFGHNYCFGLYWTLNLLFTVNASNQKITDSVERKDILAIIFTFVYFFAIALFYLMFYSVVSLFRYNSVNELVSLYARSYNTDDDFDNVLGTDDDLVYDDLNFEVIEKDYEVSRNKAALYLNAKIAQQALAEQDQDEPFVNDQVWGDSRNLPEYDSQPRSFLVPKSVSKFTDDSDSTNGNGSLDIPRKRRRRKRKPLRLAIYKSVDDDDDDFPSLFVPSIQVTNASPELDIVNDEDLKNRIINKTTSEN